MTDEGLRKPYAKTLNRGEQTYLGYLRNRKSWVTPWDVTRLNLRGYRRRVLRAIVYTVMLGIVCLVITLLISFAFLFLSGEGGLSSSARASLLSATGVAYPVTIDYHGVHANMGIRGEVLQDDSMQMDESGGQPMDSTSGTASHFDSAIFWICIAEALLVTLIVMAFSGAYAGLFMTPVNCIKAAPFMLLRCIDGKWGLHARIWVCLPQDVCLHDFTIAINYLHDGKYAESVMRIGESGEFEPLAKQSYTMVRGVWHVNIPIGSSAGRTLLEMFMSEKENPRVQLLLQGSTSSGEILSRNISYGLDRIECGYDFAPYEFDKYASRVQDQSSVQVCNGAKFYRYAAFAKLEYDARSIDNASQDESASKWMELIERGRTERLDANGCDAFLDEHIQRPQEEWNTHLSHKDRVEINNL